MCTYTWKQMLSIVLLLENFKSCFLCWGSLGTSSFYTHFLSAVLKGSGDWVRCHTHVHVCVHVCVGTLLSTSVHAQRKRAGDNQGCHSQMLPIYGNSLSWSSWIQLDWLSSKPPASSTRVTRRCHYSVGCTEVLRFARQTRGLWNHLAVLHSGCFLQ